MSERDLRDRIAELEKRLADYEHVLRALSTSEPSRVERCLARSKCGTIADAVGASALQQLATEYLHLLESSVVVCEENGEAALALCAPGWPTEETSWREAALGAMRTRAAADVALGTGRMCFAVPIVASSAVVGAIGIAYDSHPEWIVDLAKQRLRAAARLLGEIVERKRTDDALRRAEEEAREAKERYQQVLESTTDAVFTLDRTWRITYLNSRADALISQGRALLGRNLWEAFPEAVGSPYYTTYHEVMERGAPGNVTTYYPPLGMWLEAHAFPSPEGLVVFFRDVTEAQRAATALRESEQRFRHLAETIPGIVWTADASGAVDYFNSEWYSFTGQTVEESLGWGWGVVLHPDDSQRCSKVWRTSVETGAPYEIEYRFRRHDGAYVWFLGRALPFRDDTGAVARWFGVCTDIDDQKRTHEALRESQEKLQELVKALKTSNADLEQFAWAASHDLQEPLRMVALYGQLLQRNYQDRLDGAASTYIDTIVLGAKRMDTLLNDLRSYIQVSEIVPGGASRFEAAAALESVAEVLAESIRESGARVVAGALPPLSGSEIGFQQILLNLISNSLKYRRTDGPPIIEISAEREDESRWRIVVRDNGIGIAAEYHDQIFGVFKRLHGREYAGTGIGLAICRKLVDRHGGRIWVESEPGRGAAFCFTWPGAVAG